MKPSRPNALVYGLLLLAWVLVVGWQAEEHLRVEDAARTDLRNRSQVMAKTLSAVIRAMRFRGGVLQQRLEPVLNELVDGSTNQLVKPSELISVALLNTTNGLVVSAGEPVDLSRMEIPEDGYWGPQVVTFVTAIEGARVTPDGVTNSPATVVIPGPPPDYTNLPRDFGKSFLRREPPTEGELPPLPPEAALTNDLAGRDTNLPPPGAGPSSRSRGDHRPPWLRGMDEKDFRALIQTHELHGLVLAMSTEKYRAIVGGDLWLRYIIDFFAGVTALGVGLAWRSISKTSELQIQLVRASELNSHLREMNLAAAGLAHETRNPLNIIRGMAQMLAKAPGSPPGVQEKSRAIVNEPDKVTAQLNEFINYSRPREVRRARIPLNSAISEVVRTLGFDIEEKKLTVETAGDSLAIEADEQLLRQVLFNLLMNAVQAVGPGGRIKVVTRKSGASEAVLEIRDDGPGVPLENRQEIFKPYFTTNQKGTGLGLAVVQQIVLAHGWEIACLPNEPRGAVFRIYHLKLLA